MEEEKKSIYIETTVVSYYTSIPSKDMETLVHQNITQKWWPMAIKKYNVFISEVVISEAGSGDPSAAKKRLEEIKNFTTLKMTKDVDNLSQIYIEELDLPPKAIRDADHIAIACLNNIDFLVTWNCTHLCNGEIIKKLEKVNKKLGINTSIILTPENLME